MAKYEPYRCPYCGSDDLEWNNTDYEGYFHELISDEDIKCNRCGRYHRVVTAYTADKYSVYDDDYELIYDSDRDEKGLIKSKSPRAKYRVGRLKR